MPKQDVKAELQRAKAHIQAKEYSQARKILKKVDHATARNWLAQIDKIAPEQKSDTLSWWIGGSMIAVAIGLFMYMGITALISRGVFDFSAQTDQVEAEPSPQTLELIPASDANATAIPGTTNQLMMYQPPQNWYSQGATFRSCPTLSDACDTGQVLLTGDPVLVLGEIEGETWLSSRTWYYIENEGEMGFVHSELITVTTNRPTSTPAPQRVEWPQGQPSSGASSGSGGTTSSQPATPVCDCSGNRYNCSDFPSQSAARACYSYCVSQGKRDVHNMDGDYDGIACEGPR